MCFYWCSIHSFRVKLFKGLNRGCTLQHPAVTKIECPNISTQQAKNNLVRHIHWIYNGQTATPFQLFAELRDTEGD